MYDDLKGVFPALITPLTKDETIDEKALKQIIKSVLDEGVNGLVILGSSGEGVMLDSKEKYRAIEIAVNEANGRVPVIAGTSDISTRKIKENNRMAANLGASYVLVFPPFYFKLRNSDVKDFYTDLASENTIPIILYNIPQNSKITIEPAVIEDLSKLPMIAGIKDSSGNWPYLQNLILNYQNEKFKVYVGNAKNLYAAFTAGVAGSITPVPNLDPKTELDLYKNVVSNHYDKALELQKRESKIASLFEYDVLPVSIKAKAALKIMGKCENTTIKPLPEASAAVQEEVKRVLGELNLL